MLAFYEQSDWFADISDYDVIIHSTGRWMTVNLKQTIKYKIAQSWTNIGVLPKF